MFDFNDRTRTEARILNILGMSWARAKHKLYFISSCLARAQLVPRMFKKHASEARFLNKSKFVASLYIARDPRVHVQLENKAVFFKHSKLEILGS